MVDKNGRQIIICDNGTGVKKTIFLILDQQVEINLKFILNSVR